MKQRLISLLINQLSGVLHDLDVSIESTRQEALQAPSRMESRYDSAKQEASYRANELIERRLRIQEDIKNLSAYAIRDAGMQDGIEEGTLFSVQDDRKKVSRYFLLPAGQGEVLVHPDTGENIFVISLQSPIASVFLDKKTGDACVYRDRRYVILSVQ